MIPSIASRMDENQLQQLVFFKYFIETIQKQQAIQAIDLPKKIVKQSSVKEFVQESLEENEEQLINPSARSTNLISPRRDCRSNTSSPKVLDGNHDDGYWQRRRKNNEAARRSRDTRRMKEDEIALRAALLEQENVKLRLENLHLKQENVQLRCQISTSTNS